jgi:uncharacterized hydrophobic protein (TIGR00341 family)
MALRLIEMVLREQDAEEVRAFLNQQRVVEHRQVRLSDGEVLVRILLEGEGSEAVLDLLEKRGAGGLGNRVVILPVEATLPRAVTEPAAAPEQPTSEKKTTEGISREEMYEDIKNAARCSRTYLAMVVLSTIVSAIGLCHNSVAVIIGALVIAPLLGPSMALSLGTTLGDLSLLWRALRTILAGIVSTMALSLVMGVFLRVDPAQPEVAARTRVELGDITVALASGCAGALAFTTGVL